MGICSEKNRNRKIIDIYEDFFDDPDSERYDMILNFYSFQQLKKDGWTCYFTSSGKEKYNKCLNDYNIVIGILGMKNRGKSYLLGRIMENDDYKPPTGFLITTYGISCNFPKMQANGSYFITLDTAGKDSPLLQNEIFKENNIKNFVRDQAITEIVLSDFIIQESNILIAVLEQLSFEEQEMLKTLIERLKKKDIKGIQKRRLIVIHNLMNITEVEDIKNFVNEVILRSLTFKLESQSMRKNENYDDSDKNVYIQILDNENQDQNKLEIIHLIFGNDDNEEIREEHNEPALRYIRDYITINSTRKFDIVQSFKNFIIKNSTKYLTGGEFKENAIIIGNEEKRELFTNKEKTRSIEKIIVPLKSKNQNFEVKGFIKDLGGNETFFNKINPRYSSKLIKKGEKYFIEIIFELFGKIKKLKRKILSDEDKNQYIILIKGEIEEIEKIDKFIGNLEYTEFDFQIIISKFIMTENGENEMEIDILEQEEKDLPHNENKFGVYKINLETKVYINDI